MQPVQAKITKKLLLRFAIGLFALGGLVIAFWWFKSHESDPHGDDAMITAGWIAAIETTGDVGHAVVFTNEDKLIRQPNPPPDNDDRDLAWRPDGNYIFFSSNREKDKYTMHRWHPNGGAAEMRSAFGLPQTAPFFLASDADKHNNALGLVTAPGRIMLYDAKKPGLMQELPPPDPKRRVEEGSEGKGQISPFEAVYERYGTSFRNAKWTPDKQAIFAVMRSETGETLIYQKLEADPTKPEATLPAPVLAGDRIEFDIDQHTGVIYFSVQNFQWPTEQIPSQFVKNGRVTTPYRHGIGMIDISATEPAKRLRMIAASQDDKSCFGAVSLALSGDKLAIVQGSYLGNGNMTPKALLMAGLKGSLQGQIGAVMQGEIYEPNWSPDGHMLAFARRESRTSRPIYVLEEGTSTPRRVSPQEGVFGFPVFSPQTPAKG